MPGPFPGMDPYLEQPALWSGVHQGLITGIRDALNAALPSGYVADIGERVVLTRPDRSIFPDVVTFTQTPPILPTPFRVSLETRAGSAVMERETADTPLTVDVDLVEAREVFVEVRPVGDETEVLCVIEVLSPANKAPGHVTRDRYLSKQRALLDSTVCLIEMDLLRTGAYTVAVPEYALRSRLPVWEYLICSHRGGQAGDRDRFEVWPPTARDRLPRLPVPLGSGTPDVILDLQAVFDRNYDGGAYRRRINYNADALTPLVGDDALWADTLLRERGLRP